MIEVEPTKKRIHLGNCVVDEGTIALTAVDLQFSNSEEETTLYEGTPVVLETVDKKGRLEITDYEGKRYYSSFITYFSNSFLQILPFFPYTPITFTLSFLILFNIFSGLEFRIIRLS